jgi:hypothetical protein
MIILLTCSFHNSNLLMQYTKVEIRLDYTYPFIQDET